MTPVTFPLVGYVIGGLVTVPLLLPLPAPTGAVLFVLWLYLITGINHADGLADLGDALVIHGDASERRAIMKDTTVGVGAVLSLSLVVLGLGLAGLALASGTLTMVLLAVTAEVGAKLGMAMVACFGTATHDGLGSELTTQARPRSLVLPVIVTLPAGVLTPAAAITLGAALLAALFVFWWARTRLSGVNGDVFGASNEIARVIALHIGVIAWMHF